MQVGLIVVEHDEDIGSESRYLPADLRSDRTPGPRDEDASAVEGVPDRSQVGHASRRPSRSSIRGSRADRMETDGSAMELMMSVRSGTIFITISASSLARTHRSTTDVVGIGDGQQHLLDLQLLDRGRQVVDGADDRHPHQREPVRALVVVDDGNREHAAARVAQHAPDNGGSGILAAHHGHPDAHASVRSLPAEQTRMEAQEADARGA